MSGNVWEWCQDVVNGGFENIAIVKDSWMRKDQSRHVLRGGFWEDVDCNCTVLIRKIAVVYLDYNNLISGFRLTQD